MMEPYPATFTVGRDGDQRPFACVPGAKANREIAEMIFNGTAYPLPLGFKDVRCIVDVGANVGAASVWFSAVYPDAIVQAYEPNPEVFPILRQNAAHWPNVYVAPVGLFDHKCQRTLFESTLDTATASVMHHHINKPTGPTVTLLKASDELAWLRPTDILKLDCEGCERQILRDLYEHDMIDGIRLIYLEYHSERDRLAIDAMLTPTHILFGGRVWHQHRGEFTYLHKGEIEGLAREEFMEIDNAN